MLAGWAGWLAGWLLDGWLGLLAGWMAGWFFAWLVGTVVPNTWIIRIPTTKAQVYVNQLE